MSFSPPLGLRNPHVQTVFSSVGPRRFGVVSRFKRFQAKQQEIILECDDGVRLAGYLNQAHHHTNKKLVILIHGWLGSADSSYMLSMATALLEEGVDVFRLNLRDHGDTHHLNQGVFNSTLIQEVISAIETLQAQFNYASYYLGGFSLGGNFSLRVASMSHDRNVNLEKVFVFCPALDPRQVYDSLNQPKNRLYHHYFLRKWKKSLRKKLLYFPEYQYHAQLDSYKTLTQMNEELIPQYTPYQDVDSYFEAYSLTGDFLQNTICPCYLYFAADDMIIPKTDIPLLADNPDLHITIFDHGGHCGFLENWKLKAWQDQEAVQLVTQS